MSSNDEVIEPITALSMDQNNSLYSLMQPKLKTSAVHSAAQVQHRFTKEQKENKFEKVNIFLNCKLGAEVPFSITDFASSCTYYATNQVVV